MPNIHRAEPHPTLFLSAPLPLQPNQVHSALLTARNAVAVGGESVMRGQCTKSNGLKSLTKEQTMCYDITKLKPSFTLSCA